MQNVSVMKQVASPNPMKPVLVSASLHAALKEKARKEGRVLQAMVQEHLEKLVEPQLALTGGAQR